MRSRLRLTVLTLTVLTWISSIPMLSGADTGKQVYELRTYVASTAQQRDAIVQHWQDAAIPAYNRLGVRPIGVFTELQDAPTNSIYVLLPFESMDAFAASPARLAADSKYQAAGADYLQRSGTNAAFDRMESALLTAFDGMKQLAPPPATGVRADWVFELRTYKSASENRGWNKIRMFNDGEISVMQETGLAPVFFGQNLTGSHLPSLTYMTCGENLAEHQKHWKTFGASPGWNALKNDPQYKDNMTGMIKVLLKRTPASQL
jgi:hypothetical protein